MKRQVNTTILRVHQTDLYQEETIVILKALDKEHIDEVIKVSKEMNERVES